MRNLMLCFILMACGCGAKDRSAVFIGSIDSSKLNDGQMITAFGYFMSEFENTQLSPSKYGAVTLFDIGPWVVLEGNPDPEHVDSSYAVIQGVVDLSQNGHMGMFPYVIKNAVVLERVGDVVDGYEIIAEIDLVHAERSKKAVESWFSSNL